MVVNSRRDRYEKCRGPKACAPDVEEEETGEGPRRHRLPCSKEEKARNETATWCHAHQPWPTWPATCERKRSERARTIENRGYALILTSRAKRKSS